MSMIDRLTGMTDADLKRLQVNAVRLSAGGKFFLDRRHKAPKVPKTASQKADDLVASIDEALARK